MNSLYFVGKKQATSDGASLYVVPDEVYAGDVARYSLTLWTDTAKTPRDAFVHGDFYAALAEDFDFTTSPLAQGWNSSFDSAGHVLTFWMSTDTTALWTAIDGQETMPVWVCVWHRPMGGAWELVARWAATLNNVVQPIESLPESQSSASSSSSESSSSSSLSSASSASSSSLSSSSSSVSSGSSASSLSSESSSSTFFLTSSLSSQSSASSPSSSSSSSGGSSDSSLSSVSSVSSLSSLSSLSSSSNSSSSESTPGCICDGQCQSPCDLGCQNCDADCGLCQACDQDNCTCDGFCDTGCQGCDPQ